MPESNEAKRDITLRETIDEAFKALAPEEELDVFLETLRHEFQRDRSSALAAFEAIRTIAAFEWGRGDGLERIPSSRVDVPWWVIQALATGFGNYVDARTDGRITSLGEAFGLEGGGQGKRARVTQSATELRDMRLAMRIALRVSRGQTVKAAINEVIAETGDKMKFERVEQIWSKHRKHVSDLKYD